MNPFTNRGVITNEADFIGCEEQFGEIIERLRIRQGLFILRVGKSGSI